MANRQPAGDLRGVHTADERVLGAPMTATSEAGPRPGVPVPVQRTSLVLEASGTLDGEVADITLSTSRAGSPGLLGAALRWRHDGEDLRSADPPTAISEWEFIDRSTTANHWQHFHAVRLPDTGRVLVAAVKDTNEIVVWRQSARGVWGQNSVENTGSNTMATLCVLPSGRVVCHYIVAVSGVSGSYTQIRMAYSDDSGGTWTEGSRGCLSTPFTKTSDKYLRLRSFYLAGQVGLLVWEQDAADKVYQYVSYDGGCTLSLVETSASANTGCFDVKVRNGTAYITWLVYDSGGSPTTQPYLLKLTSASQGLSGVNPILATSEALVEWATTSAGLFVLTANALLVDDDGVLYLYGRNHTGGGFKETFVTVSLDDGETWLPYWFSAASGISTQTLDNFGDASNYLRDIAVVPERGRAILFHRFSANPGLADDSLCAAYLGGWSTVGMPEDSSYPYGRGVAGWNVVYLPIDKPADIGSTWTEASVGAPTTNLGSDGATINCAGGESRTYSSSPTVSTPTHGIDAVFFVDVSSGTAINDVRISDGVNDFQVRVSVTTTGIVLRDLNAGVDLDTITVDTTDGVAIRLSVDTAAGVFSTDTGRVKAWYRVTGPFTGLLPLGPRADRVWTSIGSHTNLTHGGATTHRVRWGLTATGSATWKMVAYNHESYTAGNLVDANAGIRGRTLSTVTSPIHIAEGLRVHGSDGPTVKGDTWTLSTDHEHPIEAIDPSLYPSPRRTWRSTSDSTQQDIILTVDLGMRTGDLVAIYLDNVNFKTATLYRDVGGANKVADLKFSTGLQGLAFTRSQNVLVPAAGGNNPSFHFHAGCLAGAYIDFGGGVIRKVRTNDEGQWLASGAPATYPSARVYLEDGYDAADPGSGTFDIVMPRGLFITTALPSTTKLMLRIPVQDTTEGYFQIGTFMVGKMHVFAHEYSMGWSLTWTPVTETIETRGGYRRSRRLGPMQRAMDVMWDEGVATAGLYTPGTATDYVTLGYGGADALAAHSDTPRTVAGIIERTDGPVLPVVLATAIKQQGSAITAAAPLTLLDPTTFLYGTFDVESVRFDNLNGEENREPGPLGKIGTIRFRSVS